LINAKFKFNQCRDIAATGSSLIPRSDLFGVCQSTLNQDLANAQFNYSACQNSSWSLFPTTYSTSPVFTIFWKIVIK
jgi:hypothetical protein